MSTVTTRFAPSPTGYIHVGNLRTALMNYLITRKAGGTFILRLDDTDQERSKQEYADGIMRDLEWLGLHWDRVEKQSLRLDRYREAAEDLKRAGRFYECFESPTELDLKRKKLLNMGRPPVYDRASLHLTASEKDAMRAEGRDGYWRFLLNQNRIEWPDGILGPLVGQLHVVVIAKLRGDIGVALIGQTASNRDASRKAPNRVVKGQPEARRQRLA